MVNRLIGAAVLLALSALAAAADNAGFEAAYNAAEAARKKAAEVEYEWNTTAPLLQKAQDAAAAGDFDKAIKLADEAKKQGDLAYAQSQNEANHWRDSEIR
jgi:hypothetical protein